MASNRSLHGHLAQFDDPVWDPLFRVVGPLPGGWFMWMHEIELSDGTRLHAYKHVMTRRYLHLDADGRAFEYRPPDRYRERPVAAAVESAFEGWERSEPPESDLVALRRAVERLRSA